MKAATDTAAVDIESLVAEVADQFTEEVKQGRSPSIDLYAEQHPQIAIIIRQVFPALAMLGDFDMSANAGLPSGAQTDGPITGTLGDFHILRELGRGGMGVVYEAEQISIGRRVALKVLPFAAMLDKQQLARFKNEARAAGTLDHPNIVAIYSVGCERSVHFYAMQLVEGLSLAEIIANLKPGRAPSVEETAPTAALSNHPAAADTAKAALPTRRLTRSAAFSSIPPFESREYYRAIARLGVQAAEALDHAHQSGILHRDIKPANLLVDDSGKLWITDFGLARIEQDAGMTMTGDLLGTLRYMSPEQALAKRVVVDHRSDIYSLGVTLYELLTLRPAFTGDDRQELLRQIAFDEPRKPRQVNVRIPHDLETIILKAIERNPVDRYSTAQELADDLRRFSENRSIHARQPTVLQRVRKLARRHRTASNVIAATAFLCVIIATAYFADRRRQAEESNLFVKTSIAAAQAALDSNNGDEAVRSMSEAQLRIETTNLVAAELANTAAALTSESQRYVKSMTFYEAARDDRSEGEGVEIISQALALYRVTDNPRWLQEFENANLPKRHIDRVSSCVYNLLLQNVDWLIRWGGTFPMATREARWNAQCDEALKLLSIAAAFHPPSRGYYWLSANCARIKGEKDKEKQLRIISSEAPLNDAAELFFIGRDRWWVRDEFTAEYPEYTVEKCFRDFREMLRLDPTYYNAHFFMPLRLGEENRYAEALIGWYACVAQRPDDAIAISNRGAIHARLGHFDEAKADYELALSKRPDNPRVLFYVARHLATDPNEATRDGRRAVELATKACKLTEYKAPEIIDGLACAYAETEDFVSAVKWSEMAVKLCDTHRREEYMKHLDQFRAGKPWRED